MGLVAGWGCRDAAAGRSLKNLGRRRAWKREREETRISFCFFCAAPMLCRGLGGGSAQPSKQKNTGQRCNRMKASELKGASCAAGFLLQQAVQQPIQLAACQAVQQGGLFQAT